MAHAVQSSAERSGQQRAQEEVVPDDDESGMYMAVVYSSGSVGIACYDASNAEVPGRQGRSCPHAHPGPAPVWSCMCLGSGMR